MAETLTSSTHTVMSRMLRRLPPSLWNNDPAASTLQRDLYAAFAAQMAVWLENRGIARQMTLLREAQGVDLDVLLQDYGLKRYLQRPDPYARQIGINILWTAKGTFYAVEQLADLLFDQPHVTLRTGRQHVHLMLASTQAITTPYTYWGLLSQEGQWMALSIDGAVPVVSPQPPPGLDMAPGPPTPTWFTALDQFGATWYITIAGNTLVPTQTQPSGPGTTEPFSVLDGWGQRWTLAMDALSGATVTVLDTGLPGFGYWRLLGSNGTPLAFWIEGNVPTFSATPPGGATDQTPGGTPLAWITAEDAQGVTWYIHIEADSLMVTPTQPGGIGTTTPVVLLDASGTRWVLSIDAAAEATVVTATPAYNADEIVLSPDTRFSAVQLLDVNLTPWWLSIDAATTNLTLDRPSGALDVTPAGGPFRWLRVYDLTGALFYLYPEPSGELVVATVSPGGNGTAQPQTLGDAFGTLWHLGVDLGGSLGISAAPPVDYGGHATAICLTAPDGSRWFWRVDGHVLEWSEVLWPDTIDQSPWGELCWLKTTNEIGETRYVWPSFQGEPLVSAAPPLNASGGWAQPVSFLDLAGVRWHFDTLIDESLGVVPEPLDDLPLSEAPLPLAEALDALHHVEAAGTLVTLLVV